MIKRFLFALVLVFAFSFVFSYPERYRVCEYDASDLSNPISCTCFVYNGVDGYNSYSCDCVQVASTCEEVKNDKAVSCIRCYTYGGSGCYESRSAACEANGFTGLTGSYQCVKLDDNGNAVYGELAYYVYKPFYGSNPFQCNWSNSGSGGGGFPIQKKVCSNGECKCYNLETGHEETCLGNNSGSGGGGSTGGDDSGSGSGTGSGGSGSGSGGGTGSGDNGSEDGDKNGSGHEMGDGLNDYDFGDLDTSTNLPDPKDIKDVPKNEVDLGGFGISGYFDASSQCPAPPTVDLKLFGTLEISYEYFCSIARILRAVVIAFAWLSALLIIARINRG